MTSRVGNKEGLFYKCAFCVFRSSSGIKFVKHLFEAHSLNASFLYQCGISSCTHLFSTGSTFETFRSHCIRKHHDWQHGFIPNLELIQDQEDDDVSTSSVVPVEVPVHVTVRDGTLHDYAFQEVSTTYLNCDVEYGAVVQKEAIKTAAAKFILTLKEKYKLTQAALDYALNEVDKLLLMSWEAVEQRIDPEPYLSPFDDLKTEYQQTKYYKEKFGLIVSVYVHVYNNFSNCLYVGATSL